MKSFTVKMVVCREQTTMDRETERLEAISVAKGMSKF